MLRAYARDCNIGFTPVSTPASTPRFPQVSETADAVNIRVKIQVWGMPNLYTEVYRKASVNGCKHIGKIQEGPAELGMNGMHACIQLR